MIYARTKILIAAGIAGLITAALLYFQYFAPFKGPSRKIDVVVASTFISANTIISPGMIRLVRMPESDTRPDVAMKLAQVNQKVTIVPIESGEQVSMSRLVDKSAVYGLSAIVPPGTIAMTIMVNAADAVAGFLQPGDHVDIIASMTDGKDTVARTILQNVVLLGVNASIGSTPRPMAPPPQGPPTPPPTTTQSQEAAATKATIAVTPAEAERLVAAQYKGKLKLGLRGLNDASRAITMGASVSGIFGLSSPQAPAAQQPMVSVAPTPKWAGHRIKKIPRAAVAGVAQVPPEGIAPFLPPAAGSAQAVSGEGPTIRVIKGGQVQEVQVAH